MTGGQQSLAGGGANDPTISWVGQTFTVHDPVSKPQWTSADMVFRADGTYAYIISQGGFNELGRFITPQSGIVSSNMQIIAQFVAGVTTYVTGPGLNIWFPCSQQNIWGVQVSGGAPVAGNVILRFTLRNGWSGLQIGPSIDVNYDVQRN